MKKAVINTLLIAGSLLATFFLAIGADRLVGLLAQSKQGEVGILFTPNSEAAYKTFEFDFVVRTNNFGFRGTDIELPKRGKTRVIAIGDSFTYGWGVRLEDTWVNLVEDRLRTAGHDVEMLNLGIPGAWPGRYAETAEDAAPLLKPDLIVVGLLQGDDLRQCDRVRDTDLANDGSPGPAVAKAPAGPRTTDRPEPAILHQIRHDLFPNLTGVAAQRRNSLYDYLHEKSDRKWNFIANQWKKQHKNFIHSLNASELERFHSLPEHLQKGFENGDLNPANLWYLIRGGGIPTEDKGGAPRLSDEFNLKSALMQQRIAICAENLERIKKVAASCGARVLVVSVPAMAYVTPSGWKRLYADMASASVKLEDAESLVTTVPDEAARAACDRAGVEFREVTAAFREKSKGVKCFYDYDTHFTEEGNRIFADLVAPIIAGQVK